MIRNRISMVWKSDWYMFLPGIPLDSRLYSLVGFPMWVTLSGCTGKSPTNEAVPSHSQECYLHPSGLIARFLRVN